MTQPAHQTTSSEYTKPQKTSIAVMAMQALAPKHTSINTMVQMRRRAGITGSTILQALRDPTIRAHALQRRSTSNRTDPQRHSETHTYAARGVQNGGAQLPHLDAIQASFGRHNVRAVQASQGPEAREATRAIGAEAYAYGDRVAFGNAPSLHTAAHEAAHVVQQRAGVSLEGGVGRVGDPYEQHADAVADAVVAGQSAEPLLDAFVQGSPTPKPTQNTLQRKENSTEAPARDEGNANTASPEDIRAARALLDHQVLAILDRSIPAEQRSRVPRRVSSLVETIEHECIRISSALDALEDNRPTDFASTEAIGAAILEQKQALLGVRDALASWGAKETAQTRKRIERMRQHLQEQSALIFNRFAEHPGAFSRMSKGLSYKDALKHTGFAAKGLGELNNLFCTIEDSIHASNLDSVAPNASAAAKKLGGVFGKVKGSLDLLSGWNSSGGLKSSGQDLIGTAQNGAALLVFLDDWTGNTLPNVAVIAELTKQAADQFHKVHTLTQKGNEETHRLFGVVFKPGAEVGGKPLYDFMGALMRGENLPALPPWILNNHDTLQQLAAATGASTPVPKKPAHLKRWLTQHKRIVCNGIYGGRLSPEGFLQRAQ